jgi:arylsulfatase A-like enzyme
MSDRPNIVWLLNDHQVFAHHLWQDGPKPEIPQHDRLCREGVEFTQAYSVCPLCQPARGSMLTGLYPHRTGMIGNANDCGSKEDFDADTRLFSHHLREVGYRTGYFGKWHCGSVRGPLDYEFEGWSTPGYGNPYGTPAYADYLEELGLPDPTVRLERVIRNPENSNQTIVLNKQKRRGEYSSAGGVMTSPIETHEAYFVTHLACRWLEEIAQNDQPFCLRVDAWGPHHPYFVAEPFAGTVDPKAIPEYPNFRMSFEGRPKHHADCLSGRYRNSAELSWEEWQPTLARAYEHATMVDAAQGRVLDALDRLGLADNTLVFYTADHGDLIASNGGGFDKGWLMVEETMRIPLALRWPGRIPEGKATDGLVTNMDLVPTLLEAAGAATPSPMDGRSVLPLAQNPGGAPWREDLMCEHHCHWGRRQFQRLLRWKNYKYVAHLDDMDELYDLSGDPYELQNLLNDATSKSVLDEMRRRLLRQMDEHADHADDAAQLRRQMER